jgi:hypothetical protein
MQYFISHTIGPTGCIYPLFQHHISKLNRYFDLLSQASHFQYLKCFETWCRKRIEKISGTDSVRNTEVLHRVKGERYIPHRIKRRKNSWIGHNLRRNCLLKHVTERKIDERIDMTGRRERRCKQLLMTLRKERGHCNS